MITSVDYEDTGNVTGNVKRLHFRLFLLAATRSILPSGFAGCQGYNHVRRGESMFLSA